MFEYSFLVRHIINRQEPYLAPIRYVIHLINYPNHLERRFDKPIV